MVLWVVHLISFETHTIAAVSYTHLDVYKRQAFILCKRESMMFIQQQEKEQHKKRRTAEIQSHIPRSPGHVLLQRGLGTNWIKKGAELPEMKDN